MNKNIFQDYSKRVNGALKILGNIVVTDTQQKLRENKSVITGTLLNSITSWLSEKENEIRIGTDIVYAPRVEFGFVGKDKLGRYFNQPPKSYLRVTLQTNEKKYKDLFTYMMK